MSDMIQALGSGLGSGQARSPARAQAELRAEPSRARSPKPKAESKQINMARVKKAVVRPPRQPRGLQNRSLRILMIASEAQPFSKSGGLADVAGACPGRSGGWAMTSPWSRRATGASRPGRSPPACAPDVAGVTLRGRAHRGAARARRPRGAGRLPAVLRPRRHLRRAGRRLPRQPGALCVPRRRGPRLGRACSPSRRTSSTATTGRAAWWRRTCAHPCTLRPCT